MHEFHRTPGRVVAVLAGVVASAAIALIPACSSGDDKADGTGASSTTAKAGGSREANGGTGDSKKTGGPAALDCTKVLSLAEVEGLFGEPAVLEEADPISNSEELGQTTCTWTTVEDENNSEDLASQMLVLQYYDGSTMDGANFYDPKLQFPDAEPIDIGDEAYVDAEGGVDIGFLDGTTSGFLSWSAVDLSGDAPDPAAEKDAVVALARTFHDRVG